MQRISTVVLAVALAVAVAPPAHAATPLDPSGEVTGFVPPGKNALKCERYMNKRVTLVSMCTLQCHTKNAEKIFRGLPFDEEGCEDTASSSCKAKYDRSLDFLSSGLCPPCLDASTYAGLYTNYQTLAETTLSGLVYCDPSGVPFGGDDEGSAPLQKDISKCAGKFARNVVKLIKCIKLKCHRNVADDLFAGNPYDVQKCQDTDPLQSCKYRYEKANTSLVGCPPCLDATHRAQVFDTVEQELDSRNGLVYCAQ
jgi:hypothetical protein